MEQIILIHGSGHKAASWTETVSCLDHREDVLCPELSALLGGKEAGYSNLYAAFADYCAETGGPVHLCGLSLGGILALNYVLDFPDKVRTLVLIGTPHKVPKAAFALQNLVFRLLPKSMFETMAFDKKNTFALGNSMKNLDFSGRVSAIRVPHPDPLRGKGQREPEIRPLPGTKHQGGGITGHRAHGACGE